MGSATDYDTDNYDANAHADYTGSGNVDGYYDEYGNWVEGYYDEQGNWISTSHSGSADYFEQTYVDDDGDGVDDRAQMGYEGYTESGIDANATWGMYYDDYNQAPYYYNNYTGETVWEAPPGFVSPYASPEEAPRFE
eukprot:CAMPEP_0203761678 /NCGR_PEP_ID=MMETSP0098-20131031/14712_1 /ASSEMBLY_ACC=CAM_ASM_000208 /TAXON_ID=96639 /ORGANISM=" , Strain NY0313808BC1" /LENGTH=136 /DNA_ID=CAMNT_0050655775 /DNA_START=135 /DNA_END=545 /DNA_ORIENTATION=+